MGKQTMRKFEWSPRTCLGPALDPKPCSQLACEPAVFAFIKMVSRVDGNWLGLYNELWNASLQDEWRFANDEYKSNNSDLDGMSLASFCQRRAA